MRCARRVGGRRERRFVCSREVAGSLRKRWHIGAFHSCNVINITIHVFSPASDDKTVGDRVYGVRFSTILGGV